MFVVLYAFSWDCDSSPADSAHSHEIAIVATKITNKPPVLAVSHRPLYKVSMPKVIKIIGNNIGTSNWTNGICISGNPTSKTTIPSAPYLTETTSKKVNDANSSKSIRPSISPMEKATVRTAAAPTAAKLSQSPRFQKIES